MTFKEALKILNINDYSERIFKSSSTGELFHLNDYFILADIFKDAPDGLFRSWFIETVESAEKHWERPESIFQHIPKCLKEQLETLENE